MMHQMAAESGHIIEIRFWLSVVNEEQHRDFRRDSSSSRVSDSATV